MPADLSRWFLDEYKGVVEERPAPEDTRPQKELIGSSLYSETRDHKKGRRQGSLAWFTDEYKDVLPPKKPEVKESPAKKALFNSRLYREYRSLEAGIGDTIQERERLKGADLAAVIERPDPITVERLATSIGLGQGDLLTTAPKTKATIPSEGKKVFTDPDKWNEIIDQAPEEAAPVSFKKSFEIARAKGKDEFEYQGKRFNTRKKGESGSDWARYLKARKISTALVREIPVFGADERVASRRAHNIAAAKGGIFTKKMTSTEPIPSPTNDIKAAMQVSGLKVAKDKNVDVNQLSPKIAPALKSAGEMLTKAGITPEITSGKRSNGNWSLHEIGEAVDLRLKNASPEAIKKLEDELPGNPISTRIHNENGRMWKKDGVEYIIHGEGSNVHLHIEREAEDTKAALAEHLKSQGKGKNISRRGLKAYPKLFNKYFPGEQG